MMNFIKKKLKEEKGLTLIELLAVIVILGIIAAIAIPAIGNIMTNSTVNALKGDAQNVLAAGNLYFTEKSTATDEAVDIQTLLDEGFLDDAGGFNTDGTVNGSVTKRDGGGNTISGTASNGDVNVVFTNATNAMINDIGTAEADSTDNITINR